MSASDNDSDWSDVVQDNNENDDGEAKHARCLFCPRAEVSVKPLLSHMTADHHVNIEESIVELNLDTYTYFKFINYIRKSQPTPSDISGLTLETFSSDVFLKPVFEEDLLLQYDIEHLLVHRIEDAPTEIEELKSKLGVAEERAKLAEEFLERTIDDLNKCRKELNNLLLGSGQQGKVNGHLPMDSDDNECYFSSYAHYAIHEEMLKDKVRTGAYESFILNNPNLFQGARVLDVGCGTSVLAMFASKAGAKEVIGVDNSEVAYQAMDIVRENKLDNVIRIQKGKAEELIIDGKVDIIISEWMGYFLLFESMLDTVMYCRDNYLAETGSLYPDKCNISLLALDDSDLYDAKVEYWKNVYGFKMSAMKRSVIEEPLVAIVNADKVISEPAVLKEFDLMTISKKDLVFEEDFSLKILKAGTLSAFVGYFDIGFESKAQFPVRFSTSPSDVPTHWKQTVFFLNEPMQVKVGDCVQGRLKCRKNTKDSRSLDIDIDIYVDGKVAYHQLYCMA